MSDGTERRTVCAKCGMFFGGFHKHCDGEWVEEVRTVSPWQRVEHEHLYADLWHAWLHAAPDDPTEDADGYVTWNGKSPNAMNSADTEDA